MKNFQGYIQKTGSVLLVAAITSGCAYLTEGEKLGPITPMANSVQPSVEHSVGDFSFSLDGGKMVTSNFAGKLINENVLDAWVNRHYISDHEYVEKEAFTGKADYNLTLTGSQYGESSIGMQILSGLTLFLIPYTVTTNYDIQFTFADAKTGKKYTGSVEESNKAYVELFLLFALPFAANNESAMFERIGDHLYDQLYRQGAFQPVSSVK